MFKLKTKSPTETVIINERTNKVVANITESVYTEWGTFGPKSLYYVTVRNEIICAVGHLDDAIPKLEETMNEAQFTVKLLEHTMHELTSDLARVEHDITRIAIKNELASIKQKIDRINRYSIV